MIAGLLLTAVACSATPDAASVDTAPYGSTSLQVTYSGGSTVEIQEPYRARTTTGKSGFAWSESGVYTVAKDGTLQEATATAPDFAGPDGHLLVALPVALREGLVSQGGLSSVLGRPCREWTSLEPLDGAPFVAATSSEQTVSCVGTSDGLLLRDHWTRGGAVLRDRVATSISRGPTLAGSALVRGAAQVGAPEGDTIYTQVTPAGADLSALIGALPSAPTGQKQDLVVASRVVDATGDAPQTVTDTGTVSWTGPGTLTVLSVTEPVAGPVAKPAGTPVQLGSLGAGFETANYNGLELQSLTPKGFLVVIKSDLDESALLAWARSVTIP